MKFSQKIPIIKIREIGKVVEVKRSIAKITGLTVFMNGQVVVFESGTKGLIVGFTEGEILAVILGDESTVRIGEQVYCKPEEFRVPVGEGYLGRIVDPLGNPCDDGDPIIPDEYYPVFRDAPEVLDRSEVKEMLETGIRIIDATIPIGKGQRQLIIGDRMTGKTTIGIDTILNQEGKGVICIYCCIGKSLSSLMKVVRILKEKGAWEYTVVVAATASYPAAEHYLAPYTATAIGEYFMYRGEDVLIVFDDMTKHAWSYRQLSLLLERPPGREAYPGDIFYIHSQLMERAGKLTTEKGGGSMTFFPIVDTLEGDVTEYVPSNLISMTDGQIYLSTKLFSSGFKPAIDLGLSVSRIGSKAQSPALREVSSMLRLEYLQFVELEKITRFKTAVSEEVLKKLRHGEIITQIFVQEKNNPCPLPTQLIILYAVKRRFLEDGGNEEIEYFKTHIYDFAKKEFPFLVERLEKGDVLDPQVVKELDKCLKDFKAYVLEKKK